MLGVLLLVDENQKDTCQILKAEKLHLSQTKEKNIIKTNKTKQTKCEQNQREKITLNQNVLHLCTLSILNHYIQSIDLHHLMLSYILCSKEATVSIGQ